MENEKQSAGAALLEEDLRRTRIAGVQQNIEQHIRDYGHSVLAVFPTKPEDGATFCYTIGRSERGKAELFLMGVRGEIGQMLLNAAAEEIDGWDEEATPGKVVTEAANFPLRVGSVGDSALKERLCQAVYRGEQLGYPVRAVQLVLCDSDGRYPGEPGFNAAQMQGQLCMTASGEWDYAGP